ncbi:MAG: prepilin-type N-terminal cleavage/methylation domain-containing protein [Nitrospirae bacterium]|nr:prepilin-type N-terminal cleavage/methylation domain-containing protein [Nitrospirota bacterium]
MEYIFITFARLTLQHVAGYMLAIHLKTIQRFSLVTRYSSLVTNKGFTLVEVIVAIAVLSITLVAVMQLFSGGLRASRTSCDYTRAVVHAKDKMEELSLGEESITESKTAQGSFEDGFKWEAEVEPYDEGEAAKQQSSATANLLKVKVKVFWNKTPTQQSSVELVSLKTVTSNE